MIRVLSCNLYFGRADAAALQALLREQAVDIVCAQELTPRLARAIAELLPHGDLNDAGSPAGNGIASRLPVTVHRIPMRRRAGLVATLQPAEWQQIAEPLQIVNVHIAAPHLWPYYPSRTRRRQQLEALLADRAGADGMPHAIVGDFNASPAWAVYRRMRERYDDAAVVAANGSRPPRTWPSLPRFGIDGLLRIDHCFVAGLEAVAARTVSVPGSDHRGLLVDLALPAAVPQAPGERPGA